MSQHKVSPFKVAFVELFYHSNSNVTMMRLSFYQIHGHTTRKLITRISSGGTVMGDSGNFGKLDLAVGSRSLEWVLEGIVSVTTAYITLLPGLPSCELRYFTTFSMMH